MIVVIGILAAIVIVAYTGISQRAVAASLQSDLDGASKQLSLYQVENSAYPVGIDCSATPTTNTICLKSSGGTSYSTFTPNNTASPQTFCLTATNGTTNYFINQDGTPTNGGCSVTNLIANPVPRTNSVGYYSLGNHTFTWTNGGSALGGTGLLSSTPTSTNADGRAACYTVPSSSLTPGATYTFSAYAQTSAGPLGLSVGIFNLDTYGSLAMTNNINSNAPVGTWARLSGSFVALSSPPTNGYAACVDTNGSTTTQSIYASNWMFTSGPTLYTYADGSSTGWIWDNGTANASTSTGLPL